MTNKKKILIIGCNGQVGSELVRSFVGSCDLVLADIVKPLQLNHQFATVDLSDHASTTRLIRDVKPEIIIKPSPSLTSAYFNNVQNDASHCLLLSIISKLIPKPTPSGYFAINIS